MPYIDNSENRRNILDKIVEHIGTNFNILGNEITKDYMYHKECADLLLDLNMKVNGDLNYLLYALAKRYLKPSYNNYKTFLGKLSLDADGDLPMILTYLNHELIRWEITTTENIEAELECCKLEIYRRLVAPYEDKKKDENGDVEG
jgi:hypothetical protein